LLVGFGVLTPQQAAGRWLTGQELLLWVQASREMDWVAIAAVSLVIGVGALLLLLRMLGGGGIRGSSSVHTLIADEKGFVIVHSRGISTAAAQAAMSCPGVVTADVVVRGDGSSPVQLRAEVGVHSGANLKEAGTRSRDAVQQAVEEFVGINVRGVTVAVRVLEPEQLGRLIR
jgi:hypothetical protein